MKKDLFVSLKEKTMEKAGYILLAVVALVWLGILILGMIEAWPWGIVGFLVLAGIGLLFAKVVRERLENEEDDYYSKNIDK
jgi:membrane protein implicated in regulation of membrane protease activity